MESLKSCSFGCKALPCWHPGSLRYPGEVSKLQITCACTGKLVYPVKLVWVCHSLFWRISGKYPYPPPLHGWTFRLDPHHLFEFPYVLYNSPKPLESFVTYSRFAVNLKIMNCLPFINHCSLSSDAFWLWLMYFLCFKRQYFWCTLSTLDETKINITSSKMFTTTYNLNHLFT